MVEEIWKEIAGFENYYMVSSMGNVKSLGYSKRPAQTKRQYLLKNGYLQARIWLNGKVAQIGTHRLVAIAFIPNPDKKSQVNHINGVKADNRAENLEWSTQAENTQHAYDTGLARGTIGVPKIWQFKKILQVDLFGNKVCEYDSIKEASQKTGIPCSNITMCAKGRQSRTGQFKWQYL